MFFVSKLARELLSAPFGINGNGRHADLIAGQNTFLSLATRTRALSNITIDKTTHAHAGFINAFLLDSLYLYVCPDGSTSQDYNQMPQSKKTAAGLC